MSDQINSLGNLPDDLINENGGGFGFVLIWRHESKDSSARKCTVGEFLSRPENQIGTWLIDGGCGPPLGPIEVDWDDARKCWVNRGFGRRGDGPTNFFI